MLEFKSVIELNEAARGLLEGHFGEVSLEAEISKITKHSSGHWYFTLKDEQASIDATMFRGANLRVTFEPKVGLKVVCAGKLTLFSATGRYQINVLSMKEAGAGDLDAAFRALCARLEKAGVARRNINGVLQKVGARPLPRLPKRVGIVTSLSSAAFADIKQRIESSGYFLSKFICFDTLVQGKDAAASIMEALSLADSAGLDVIILARGGGSKEDLWCFNDENLARKILSLKTPIISAVGHEIDYSISDFVSDHRSITPTAAIADLLPSKDALAQFIDTKLENINLACSSKLEKAQNRLNIASLKLSPSSIKERLDKFNLNINTKQSAIKSALDSKILSWSHKIENLKTQLKAKQEIFETKRSSVSVFVGGNQAKLDELKIGDKITLKSAYASKEAQIL